MNPKTSPSPSLTTSSSLIIITALFLFAFCEFGVCRVDKDTMLFGGIRDIPANGLEIENLARFAVEEHNKKENSLLKFARLVKAKDQVVAGKMYYLTLEANDGGKIKVYEAKVWVKPWMNFKQVQEFKISNDQTLV